MAGSTQAGSRRAAARVDLGAIAANVETLRAAAPAAQVLAVVKADAYGHGLVPVAAAARAGGAAWLGTALLDEALALRAAGDTGRLLSWLLDPDDDWAEAVGADIDLSASAPWARRRCRRGCPDRGQTRPPAPQGRHRPRPRGCTRPGVADAGRARRPGAGRRARRASSGSGRTSRTPTRPATRPSMRRSRRSARRSPWSRPRGFDPEVRHLANSRRDPHPPRRPLRPRPAGASPSTASRPCRTTTRSDTPRPPARDDRSPPGLALVKRLPAGQGVSYVHRYTHDGGDDARPGAARVRRRRAAQRHQRRAGPRGRRAGGPSRARCAWTSSSSTSGTTRCAGRRRGRALRAGDRRRADRRRLGARHRHHLLRDRHADRAAGAGPTSAVPGEPKVGPARPSALGVLAAGARRGVARRAASLVGRPPDRVGSRDERSARCARAPRVRHGRRRRRAARRDRRCARRRRRTAAD